MGEEQLRVISGEESSRWRATCGGEREVTVLDQAEDVVEPARGAWPAMEVDAVEPTAGGP